MKGAPRDAWGPIFSAGPWNVRNRSPRMPIGNDLRQSRFHQRRRRCCVRISDGHCSVARWPRTLLGSPRNVAAQGHGDRGCASRRLAGMRAKEHEAAGVECRADGCADAGGRLGRWWQRRERHGRKCWCPRFRRPDRVGRCRPGATGRRLPPPGQHVCRGMCVDSKSTENCGGGCEPCPDIKGGTKSCDGTKCGGMCPPGTHLCMGECVPEGQVCGACPAGTHDCGGICADNMRITSCGSACTVCPYPPGGSPACDGTKCGFTCDSGKACGDRCGACCTAADCPVQTDLDRNVRLDHADLQIQCPDRTRDCNGQCIPEGSCCLDADCPMMAGQVGKCDSSTRTCGYSCVGDTKPCAGRCIPSGGCCDDNGCTGNHACAGNTCSATACRSGFRNCGTTCIPETGCCEDRDCTGDFACVGNLCSRTMCRAGFMNCDGRCIPQGGCCNDGQCTGNSPA